MSENFSPNLVQNEENLQRHDATGRLFALSSITVTVIFILFFLAIAVPWAIARSESLKSAKSLSSERLLATASSYTLAIRNLFSRYEMSVEQLARLAIMPQYLYCDVQHISEFIQFGRTVSEILYPKPYRFYLAHNNTASCLLGFDKVNSNRFTLYMMTSHNSTHDKVQLYTQADTDVLDPNSGTIHQYILINESDFRFQFDSTSTKELSYWTSNTMNFGFRADNRTLSYIYLVNSTITSENSTKGGMSILNSELMEVYEGLPTPDSVKWAFLDEDLGMIITREFGAVYPISGHNGALDYPPISQAANPLWRKAGEYFDKVKQDETILIDIDDQEYYLTKTIIHSNAKLPFNFLMLYGLDEIVTDTLRPFNILLLILLVIIAIVTFLQLLLQKKNKDHKEERLSRPSPSKTAQEEYEKNSNSGILGDVIYELRQLELQTPEEVMMNKLVDTACSSFAKTKRRIFSVTNNSSHTTNCKFCRFLNGEAYTGNERSFSHHHHLLFTRCHFHHWHQFQNVNLIAENEINKDLIFHDYRDEEFGRDGISESVTNTNMNSLPNIPNFLPFQYHQQSSQQKPTTPNDEVEPFKTWEILTLNRLPTKLGHNQQPIGKRIMFEFIQFLHEKQLVFIDIDPDQLIHFAFDFIKNYCKMPEATLQGLTTLNYLFHLEYNIWVENKVDFLALLLLMLVKDIELLTSDEERDILKKEQKRRKKLSHEREKRIRAQRQTSTPLLLDQILNQHDMLINEPNNLPQLELPNNNNNLFGGLNNNENSVLTPIDQNDNVENMEIDGTQNNQQQNETDSSDFNHSEDDEIDETTDEFYRHFCLPLYDLFSIRRRQMDIFQVLLSNYITYNDCSFNHVYLKQRMRRIYETCHISNHFETFGEFQNRIESPEFSVTNNCEDLDIFLRAVYVYLDYSCYWCDLSAFDEVFGEYNQKIFTKDELMNDKFVWNYHLTIIDKIVEPFTQVFMTLCPINDLKQKLNMNIQQMQNKQSNHVAFSQRNPSENEFSESGVQKSKSFTKRFRRDRSKSKANADATDDEI